MAVRYTQLRIFGSQNLEATFEIAVKNRLLGRALAYLYNHHA
jgi:hypothetical protein